MSDTPYSSQPPKAFWRTAVAETGIWGYDGLFRSKWKLPANAAFATYGSCFAQHISRAVQANGKPWVNAEPAPASATKEVAARFGYGVYSSRTANIYTARMLELWVALAQKPERCAAIEIWENEGRFRDSLRPAIEPEGFGSHADCLSKCFRTRPAPLAALFEKPKSLSLPWVSPKVLNTPKHASPTRSAPELSQAPMTQPSTASSITATPRS